VPSISRRKAEHLELALGAEIEAVPGPGWGDLELVHQALPEIDRNEIELETELLGHRLRVPLVISGMTGGHPMALEINRTLGRAAQRHGLAVGVGSQRAALIDPSLAPTYAAVREHAPDALVLANIGAAQLVRQGEAPALDTEDVQKLIAMVEADALAIHLNFLEEAIQPEGDSRARGCSAAIGRLVEALDIPVIVKETGAGMSSETAELLRELGVAAVDVGGSGGTSFAIVEAMRAERQGDDQAGAVGATLAAWGIPTAVAVAACARAGLSVVATGGIRTGLDCAKALALGATAVGVARPLLKAAMENDAALDAWIATFARELRTVLMLTGCARPAALRERPIVITGRTRAWIDDLGWHPRRPADR
jgi:isopentenyl-diphosphate delta-isomerase